MTERVGMDFGGLGLGGFARAKHNLGEAKSPRP